MANFVMIFRYAGAPGLYALYDDMSTASVGIDGSRYIAVDQENGWFYIKTGSSPSIKLEKRSISTFALLAEYSAGSNNYIPVFADYDGRLYTFSYDGNKIQCWNTDLTLNFEWTLKVGNPLNDQIRGMAATWDLEYFYLIYNDSAGRVAKYHRDNVDGGDPEWDVEAANRQYCYTDDDDKVIANFCGAFSNFGCILYNSIDGSEDFEVKGSCYGCYSLERECYYLPGKGTSYEREWTQYNKNGTRIGYTEDTDNSFALSYCCCIDIDGYNLYAGTYMSAPFNAQYIKKISIISDWGVDESFADSVSMGSNNHEFAGDPTGYINLKIREAKGMSSGISQKVFFGIKKGTTWGTAVQLTAKCGIKAKAVGPLNLQQEVIQDESIGMEWPERWDLGRINQELTFEGDLRYENKQWMHIAQVIGDDAGTVASSIYTHIMDIQDSEAGFYCAAALIDDQVYEWESVKAVSFDLTTGADGFMQFSCTGIANNMNIAGDGTNTATTIGTTADYETEGNKIPFDQARVRINAQAGAALGTGDIVYPSAITLHMSRPYERDFVADNAVTNTKEWETSEPVESGLRNDVILTLEFPELTTDDYLENFQDAAAKKADIIFTSVASTRSLTIEFPNLAPLQPDVSLSGVGRIPQVISYQCLAVASGTGPTGMTAVSKPFRMTLLNTAGSTQYDDESAIT